MKEKIQEVYPNAMTRESVSTRLLKVLEANGGFDPERTLWATSDCSDEVNRTSARFRRELHIGDTFQLGGLAGYPFTGETGFRAFASHIPESGAAILLYGPHIGISKEGHVGYMKRVGQQKETTCCGALHGTLSGFVSGDDTLPNEETDHQMWFIAKALKEEENEIVNDPMPIARMTDRMYDVIDEGMNRLVKVTQDAFGKAPVALIGGIFINRDHGDEDWFDLRRFDVISPDGTRTDLKKGL